MLPGGAGRGYGRGGQHFGPAYDQYGGGRSHGRRRGRRRGHRARRQRGRGGIPPAHSGQNHYQGYGQEDYDQEYYDEEDYGQEGYDGSQYEGQGDWQYAHESGERWDGNAMSRSEMEASDLREQLWHCQEALQEVRRSKEQEVGALRRALIEKDEAYQAEFEGVQGAKNLLGRMERIFEAGNGLRNGLEERDQIIAQKSDEIRLVIAERDSIKGELESWKQVHRNLRSDSDRIIEDLKRKEGEAKNDAVQARTALQLANEKVIEQRAEIEAGRESANTEIQSVKRELLCAKEAAREQDRLISQKDARIEALERRLEDHNDMMPLTSTQDDANLPGPAVEVPAEIMEHIEALSAIAAWEEGFRFVEDGEFNDARTIAHVGAILSEAQPRRRLHEFLMEGPLDTWACLSRVGEHGFFAESVTLTNDLRCLVHSGGVSCRLVMVTTVDSVRRLRFLNRTG